MIAIYVGTFGGVHFLWNALGISTVILASVWLKFKERQGHQKKIGEAIVKAENNLNYKATGIHPRNKSSNDFDDFRNREFESTNQMDASNNNLMAMKAADYDDPTDEKADESGIDF